MSAPADLSLGIELEAPGGAQPHGPVNALLKHDQTREREFAVLEINTMASDTHKSTRTPNESF